MTNYKLGIGAKNNERMIDFIGHKELYALSNLDKLTCEFNDESELKLYLLKKGLINTNELSKHMNIFYQYGVLKKLPIIYKSARSYLDIDYLYFSLERLSYNKNNTDFLNKLAKHYDSSIDVYNPQRPNIQDIRIYLNGIKNGAETYSKALEFAIRDLFNKAVYVIDKTGEVKDNYRGLRDLALFIYEFECKNEKKDIDTYECEQLSLIDNEKNDYEYEQLSLINNTNDEKNSRSLKYTKSLR